LDSSEKPIKTEISEEPNMLTSDNSIISINKESKKLTLNFVSSLYDQTANTYW